MKEIFRTNNFDIVRLIAALQVAINHTMSHLEVERSNSVIISLLGFFPGVPIFFFVSGFLISKSYENNPVLKEYATNRILRIYPALITCTFISFITVYLSGYFSGTDIKASQLIIWLIGQISFVQFFNPEFMRNFGTGVLNGSLWTITVELQFYIVVPILYWIFGINKPRKSNIKIMILVFFFLMFNIAHHYFIQDFKENLLFKLFTVSFAPWIYMFLVGVIFQRNFSTLHNLLAGKLIYVLPAYLTFSYISVEYFGWGMGNGINPILYILLSISIFSFAYSYTRTSKILLKGNDISYGVYIYHIPVVNLLIYYGYISSGYYVIAAIIITVLFSIASWILVEKYSMKFKKHPLNPLEMGHKGTNKAH